MTHSLSLGDKLRALADHPVHRAVPEHVAGLRELAARIDQMEEAIDRIVGDAAEDEHALAALVRTCHG